VIRPTHESIAKEAIRLICAYGFVPGASRLFGVAQEREEFWQGCSAPDRFDDVALRLPGSGMQTQVMGKGLSPFQHFGTGGYRWRSDVSLGLGGTISSELSNLAGMVVRLNPSGGARPPMSGILERSPMELAIAEQPGVCLGDFRFPSNADVSEFYGAAARNWIQHLDNPAGWRGCASVAAHAVADSCVPHHGWGVLLFGHADFEGDLITAWETCITGLHATGTIATELVPHVRAELAGISAKSLSDLCSENAAWSHRRWGEPHYLAECPGNDAIALGVRAIAVTVRAVELMTVTL
jgi:hypothetical protein